MAPAASLVLLPADGSVASSSPLLGLPLIRRAALAARRAGFGEVVAVARPGERAETERALAGLGARVVVSGAVPEIPPGRVVLLSATLLPQTSWLERARTRSIGSERIVRDSDVAAVLQTAEPDKLAGALAAGGGAAAAFERLAGLYDQERGSLSGPDARIIRDAADLALARNWLLAGLVKDSEGFMSRHFERRISLSISRRLASTSVSPNAMSAVSLAVGLAGASLFVSTRPAVELAAALVVLLHSILDGCDGELARLKFQESRLGGLLDFWGDNVVHAAFFTAISVGWSRAVGAAWPLGLGAAAVLGTLASAALVFLHTMRGPKAGPLFTTVTGAHGHGRIAKVADALGNRDFIYVVVILSAFGKVHWFLAMAAAGAPLYFLVLVGLALAERRSQRRDS
jgi:phosphatidylglycerophosphate synthase